MNTKNPHVATKGSLVEMTMDEVEAMAPEVVVLPLGSTEPHGPHLPFGTDTFQVTEVCRLAVAKANARNARALLYPTIPITNNVNFRRFRFSLRVSVRTLMSMLVDIVTQCRDDGIRKIVIVNGHGGNPPAIDAALREIAGMDDMPFVCWTYTQLPEGVEDPIEHPSDHGGESETSIMMWIRPDLVREDRLRDNPFGELKVSELRHTAFVRPWHLYVPEACGGETRKATADKGRILIEGSASWLADLLVQLSLASFDDRFPYL